MVEQLQRSYRQGDEPVTGYHLQEFLGRGGFGEVWKAVGPGGVKSAVKIIRDLDRKRGGKELKALRLLRDIRHPNLVPLIAFWLKDSDGQLINDEASWEYEVGAPLDRSVAGPRGTLMASAACLERVQAPPSPSELIIVMGLAEKSLFDRLAECRDAGLAGVPRDELFTYMDDAARAIDLLNTKHEIQHCDIKPQNILLLSGAAQVCDFGLAKMIGEVRETSMGAGTIAYGAPEILLGKAPTASTDQYSLAISYFELRTGQLPFESERISDVLQAKQYGTVNVALLPPGEREVIIRAASIDPAERFASCQEMVKALHAGARQSLVGTSTGGDTLIDTQHEIRIPTRNPGHVHKRDQWKWLSGALVGAAALLGGIFHVGVPSRSPFARQSAAMLIESPVTDSPSGNPTQLPVQASTHAASGQAVPAADAGSGASDASSKLLHADEELAKADRVLAEADATLAAAKAALAASHAIPASQATPPGHSATQLEKIASAVESASANSEILVDSSRQTAANTQLIAESTKEIALSLDKLREQLAQAASRGGVVENPQSPSDFYHNARTFEERGDFVNARKAYLQLCSFQLHVVDPYTRFVSVLRLQEGRAGARETIAELARNSDDLGAKYAMVLLEPEETRAAQWAAYVSKHPECAPGVYEWSREFSRERLGAQGLADMAKEKELIERFLRLADEGKLLRHYFDQTVAASLLEEAKARLAALQHFESSTMDHPVRLSGMASNSSWTVILTVAEVAREIQYRLEGDEQFQSTGFVPGIDQRTGAPMPNPSLQLPLTTESIKLFVKYMDIRGREQGPFELVFDPDAERLSSGKQILEGFPHSWVSIREHDGRMLAYFTHLISNRQAIQAIRYGIDSEKLSETFPLPPSSNENPYDVPSSAKTFLELPSATKVITVQLTYHDGTQSKPQKFTVPKSAGAGQPVDRGNRSESSDKGSARGAKVDATKQVRPAPRPDIDFPRINIEPNRQLDELPRTRIGFE